MRVAFRVDASGRIGTGHVMRCLTLADALCERGVECVFVHRLHPGNMATVIRVRGYAVHELPEPVAEPAADGDAEYGEWLGVPVRQDARETAAALNEEAIDWLVVDHYALDAAWEQALAPTVGAIAVLDDLANRHHDCDLLVDQNYLPEPTARYEGLVASRTRCLCGPRHALLRPEYAEARRLIRPRRGPVSRVLVFYGGADPGNETGRALRVLAWPQFAHLAVDVVIGASNPHREAILAQAEARPLTTAHGPRQHLVDLMIEADLALGAGGTTTWERCALGLPAIVTAVAANQEPFNEALAADGIIRYLGRSADVTDESMVAALRALAEEPETLAEQACKAWRVTDGLGTERVAEQLRLTPSEALTLRPADAGDKSLYFEWANDPGTRRHAHHPEPIPWASHDAWFDGRLEDPDTWLEVLVTPEGLPVGQVRVELQRGRAVLSYSIDPAFRGRGWGTRLLELIAELWHKRETDIELTGDALAANQASRKAFLRAGFLEEASERQDVMRFRLPGVAGRTSSESHARRR